MATALQKATSAVVYKAVLIRELRAISTIYTGLTTASETLGEVLDPSKQGALAPLRSFIKSLEGLISKMEKLCGREIPAQEPPEISKKEDPKDQIKRVEKYLQDISKWAYEFARTSKRYGSSIVTDINGVGIHALEVAAGLNDMLIEEDDSYSNLKECLEFIDSTYNKLV